MKYCCICNAEYPDAAASCSVCGIDLVPEESRGRPLDERQRKEKIHVVWRGGDPVAVSEVIHLLREAGIRHHVQPSNEHLVFELGMPRPKYAVRVFGSDAAKAKELLSDIRESAPFAHGENELSPQDPEPEVTSPRPVHAWNAAAANVDVWNGQDAALEELLEACLRENQIGFLRTGSDSGPVQLRVMPADETRAREIIREVIDATPPA